MITGKLVAYSFTFATKKDMSDVKLDMLELGTAKVTKEFNKNYYVGNFNNFEVDIELPYTDMCQITSLMQTVIAASGLTFAELLAFSCGMTEED